MPVPRDVIYDHNEISTVFLFITTVVISQHSSRRGGVVVVNNTGMLLKVPILYF
jgi:hypothetical protein